MILLLTMGAVYFKLQTLFLNQHVGLADLLLMFIYAEVIAMVGVFMRSREVPVIYPIFIAITALARLIILQGKDMDPSNILYEAIAIFVLALAVFCLQSEELKKLIKKFGEIARSRDENQKEVKKET